MGAARADDHVLAGAPRGVGRALRPGGGGLRHGRQRDRGLRAGADDGRPGWGGSSAAAVRGERRGRRSPARRLVGARLGPDLRARRRRWPRGRAVRLQRLGREVGALRRGRPVRHPRAGPSGSAAPRRRALHPRRRLDRRRRRRDARHDGAVPARGAPQPEALARGDRGRAARAARRRAGRLARARARRGPRHGRARGQHLRVRRARPRGAPDRARRGEPELRALPGEPAPAARRGDRGDRAAVAALPPRRGPDPGRPLHELLRLQRRADRPRQRGGDRPRRARADRVAVPGREAVPVPGATLARGGGGVHCITQQVPAL